MTKKEIFRSWAMGGLFAIIVWTTLFCLGFGMGWFRCEGEAGFQTLVCWSR